MKKTLALALLATASFTTNAAAHGVHVKKAEIHAKEFEIHNISEYSFGSETEFANELELAYGFNEWFKAEIFAHTVDEAGEDFNWIEAAGAAAQFRVATEGQYRPLTSIYIAYETSTDAGDEPDHIKLAAFFDKRIGKFDNNLNLRFTKDSGENAEGGLGFDVAFRSVYECHENMSAGIEYFGEFGQFDDMDSFNHQGHLLGPVVMFEPLEHTHASIAYLFGLSDDAPDNTVKLELGFHF